MKFISSESIVILSSGQKKTEKYLIDSIVFNSCQYINELLGSEEEACEVNEWGQINTMSDYILYLTTNLMMLDSVYTK